MPEPSTTDEFTDLLTRVRAGDAGALAELAGRYEPDVRIAARVHLGPALRPYLDSMDVVQSVHRSLLEGLRDGRFNFDGPDKLIALAVKLVGRKVARHWRRLRHQERPDSGPGGARQVLLSLCCPGDGPATATAAADAIDHFLSDLDVTDRKLLELRLEGRTTAEAARLLGVGAGTLRVRLIRLRQRLRDRGLLEDWL